jgi:hypothetical protein
MFKVKKKKEKKMELGGKSNLKSLKSWKDSQRQRWPLQLFYLMALLL